MAIASNMQPEQTRSNVPLLFGLGPRLGFSSQLQSSLKPNQYLRSENNAYSLILNSNGGLTLNRVLDSSLQWSVSARKSVKGAELRLDNNACLSILDSRTGQIFWTTGPNIFSGHSSALLAQVTDSGTFDVIDAAGNTVWSSGGAMSAGQKVLQKAAAEKPVDALLKAALTEADGVGILRMVDEDIGTLHPVGGGQTTEVTVYIRNQNDPVLATFYLAGDASRRINVRLVKNGHSSFRVFLA